MKLRGVFIALVVALVLPASAAAVQQTWVSGVGDDANTAAQCSRTAPCKTFAGAEAVTDAGGEIDALSPGNFGSVTITKPITLNGAGTNATVVPSGAVAGITINAGTGAVVIDDITLGGAGTGTSAVRVNSAGTVRIENSDVHGWTASGIDDASSTATKVDVYDTNITSNGGDGVLLEPPGGGSGRISLENDSVASNSCGIVATSFGSPATPSFGINCGVNTSGPASGAATIIASNTSITGNAGAGVLANGSPAIDYLSSDSIRGNGTGLEELAGGQIVEIGTNTVQGNTTNGSPTSNVGSGPTGLPGATGPAGQVELIKCIKPAAKAKKNKKKQLEKCTGKLVSSPVNLRTTGLRARATLSRGGKVYGVGTVTLGSSQAALSPRRHLKSGRYKLTLRRSGRVVAVRTVVVA